jgi:uncharacterized membrane protein
MSNVTNRPGLDWRWLALALSLLCNVFLAALIAGHFLSHRVRLAGLAGGAAPMAGALQRAEGLLSAKDAATFRQVLEREKPRYAQAARQVAAARRSLGRAMVAEPFDPHAASQALDAWRANWSTFVQDFSGPLIDALAAISPEGRRRLVVARRVREQRPSRGTPPSE